MPVKEMFARESDYPAFMRGTVEPALDRLRESFFLAAADSTQLYCESYVPANAAAALVLEHGFTGSLVKFHELIFDLTNNGFAVFAAELRGHGRSARAVDNPYIVHAEHFEDYADDLRLIAEEAGRRSCGLPLFLYAHSLGGGVAALTLERQPKLFRRAVLTSPMIAPYTSPLPGALAARAAKLLARRNDKSCFGAEPKEFHGGSFANAPASSEARWSYYTEIRLNSPKLQTFVPSLGWLREATRAPSLILAKGAAEQVAVPVLLCRAGKDHLVDRRAQDAFAVRAQNCRISEYPDSRHEIYGASDADYARYINEIVSFFAEK